MRKKPGIYSEYAIAAFARAAQHQGGIQGRNVPAALRADLVAVEKTFATAEADHIAAVKAVYIPHQGNCHVPKCILRERTHAYATAARYSEQTVYRLLTEMQKFFAEYRGLTVE